VLSDDVSGVVNALPELLAPLKPLAFVPDPLARHVVIAILLAGPVKVDLIFDRRHSPEPPWAVNAQSLLRIDAHFWDWVFWLAGKQLKGEVSLVRSELPRLQEHLLEPLGVSYVPASIAEAIHAYTVARAAFEERFKAVVPRSLENAILPILFENRLLKEYEGEQRC
jgi:uncharacterized protein (DUF2062 family)